MASFTERMMGAAKLDVQVYEEVEADTSATSQAMGVVLLFSLASRLLKNSAKWDRQIDPVVLRCSQH